MALNARSRAVVVALGTVLGVTVTANLGAWQLRRAAFKIAAQDALLARASLPALVARELARDEVHAQVQFHRGVHLRGRWLPQRNVFLDNRQMQGRFGFYLVTPLQLDELDATVLVQRGWVARDQRDRTALPAVATPGAEVEIDGRIAPPPARLYEFTSKDTGVIRQNIDLAGFAAETGLPLLPMSVQQDDTPTTRGDGLLRDWPRLAVDVQMHYGYAFQWFAMCALMAGLYVWFQLLRPWIARRAGG